MHDLLRLPPAAAVDRLTREHDLDARAAENLLQYLRDQMAAAARASPTPARSSSSACATSSATGASACSRRAAAASTRRGRWPPPPRSARRPASTSRRCGETTGSWCGFRMSTQPPDPRLLLPGPRRGAGARRPAARRDGALRGEVPRERRALAAAAEAPARHARAAVAAAQARRRPAGGGVALRIVPGPARDLSRVPARLLRHAGARRDARRRPQPDAFASSTVDSDTPSPFAASLLFSYVASFLYDGDAPLAERRAQALAVDQAQLRELLGDAELRELLDAESMDAVERQLQRLDPQYRARSADGVHDMLLALGDLDQRRARASACRPAPRPTASTALVAARRVAAASRIAGETRYIAVEDAARYRDALGVPLPPGLPESLLEPVARSARRSRAALRAHARAVHRRRLRRAATALGRRGAEAVLRAPRPREGRLLEGEFRPGGTRARVDRRRRAAHAAAPIARQAAPRGRTGRSRPCSAGSSTTLAGRRQAAARRRRAARRRSSSCRARRCRRRCSRPRSCRRASSGYDPARSRRGDRRPAKSSGSASSRSASATAASRCTSPTICRSCCRRASRQSADSRRMRESRRSSTWLAADGASFFGPLHEGSGGGYPAETRRRALESRLERPRHQRHVPRAARVHADAAPRERRGRRRDAGAFRSRRLAPPSAEGRWTLVAAPLTPCDTPRPHAAHDAAAHTRG